MTGLLFGYLDKEFDEQSQLYTSLGIIHLFALSGMQVGFFLGWFRYGLLRLGLPKNYILAILLPFSIFYGLMTGWTASVLRSLIQSLLAECGIKKLNNMGITLLLFFLVLPHFLLTVGGVLSCSYAFLLCLFNFEEMPSFKKVNLYEFSIESWDFAFFDLLLWNFSTIEFDSDGNLLSSF